MARVLVTGGAGFIGSHIVDTLIADGHKLHVVDNLSSGRKENLSEDISFHQIDIREKELRTLLQEIKPEVVVHAAAQISVSESMKDPHFDTEVNVCGLINILQSFKNEDLPFFVMISTGGAIYGEQDVFPAPEDHPVRPTSVYGLAKRVSELYLELWERQFNLRYGVLRLANVYGPRQNPHGEAGVVAILNSRLLAGETPVIYGSGEQSRDFVYVKDVARAVRLMCEKKQKGVFNIGTGIESSVNTLYSGICEALGSEITPEYKPARPGEQMRSSIDASYARNFLGWEPQTSLDEGLKEALEWFRSQQGDH